MEEQKVDMSGAEASAILLLAQNVLEKNESLVSPELVQEIEELIPLFQNFRASQNQGGMESATAMVAIVSKLKSMDLTKVVDFINVFVDTEKRLQAGLDEKIINALKKAQSHQILLAMVAKLF